MTTTAEFLKALRELDVRVWLQDGRVRVSAPSGRLTSELQQELMARKEEIRRLLAGLRDTASPGGPAAASSSSAPGAAAQAPSMRRHGQSTASGEYPVSFGQRRLWFLDHLEPGNLAYNVGASHTIRAEVDVRALERAINSVLQRHEILRTTFREHDGELLQVVAPYEARTLQVIDLTRYPPAEREQEAERLKREEAKRPFDLAAGPLLRTQLLRLERDRHVLLFSMHHIICDGWSLGIFLQELGAHYQAQQAGGEPDLPPLDLQYGQYAAFEQERLSGPVLEHLLDYWCTRLADAPALLELPTDRPRPSRRSLEGAYVPFTLPAELSASLRALARQEQATLYMMLLAVFTTLLSRYSGQSDVVVGTPVANRETPQLERLIGLFVSTLAIRTQLSEDPSGRALIRQIRENVLEGQMHQDLPFEKLVEALQPERTMAWSPVFQVSFVLQNTPLASMFEVTTAASMFDLTLFCWDEPGGIRCSFEYSTDLFEAATIERMAEHFGRLAQAMVTEPDRPVSRLSMLDDRERTQLIQQWNDTARDYPREASIVALFEQVAARHPDAIALESADPAKEILAQTRLSYRELDRLSDGYSSLLRARGVRPGAIVGLYLERSAGAIVAMLSILKAGAAYLPIDISNPPARIVEILHDARVEHVITQSSLRARLDAPGLRQLVLEDHRVDPSFDQRTNPAASGVAISADDMAYAMFTSGTTGRPKGVCVTHRNVIRLVSNPDYVTLGPQETFLQFAPLAFDASTFEIWAALLHGARLVVYPYNVPSAPDLARALDRHGVTVLWLTSGFFHYMVENEPAAIARVRQVLAGGDVLSATHVQKVLDEKRDGFVVNGYGPTENTTFTCCHVMRPGARLSGSLPIGRPIANTRVYILDPHGEPAPTGVIGELYAAGDGVALGYLGDAARTAEKFVPDPFDERPGARMYRTGDLAKWRSDGTIEFFGRRDRQVKVRGFRIELEEVEDALRHCARVHDAAVIVRRDAAGTNALVAYLVPRRGNAIDQAAVRRELAQRLPDYMLPAAFVMLNALPLTANGKLDRAALPEPTLELHTDVVGPRSLLETQLLTIWESIFGRTGFGVRDNFFDLGGHSLLAVRMFAQVERVFGRRLPASALFHAPTIEQLAKHLESAGMSSPWNSLVAIQPRGTRPPLFLVPGMGGNVVGYVELAKLLGPDQPFYGLQARGLDGREKPFEDIVPMAQHYVDEIRKVQPHGPYHLGGACFGGVVAYEMAQQLRAAGHEVAFLMLLETWPPARRSALRALLLRQSQHLRFLSAAIRRNLGELPRMSPRKALGAMLRWARIVGEMISRQDIYRGDSAAMYVDRVSLSNHKAFCAYRPRPYDGSALLVLASARRIHGSQDPRLFWGRLVRSYAKEEIPALDSGLVLKSPHVESLARIMTQYLRDSRQEPAVQPAGATPSAHAGVSVSASVSLNT